jgi:hypothetical protein
VGVRSETSTSWKVVIKASPYTYVTITIYKTFIYLFKGQIDRAPTGMSPSLLMWEGGKRGRQATFSTRTESCPVE